MGHIALWFQNEEGGYVVETVDSTVEEFPTSEVAEMMYLLMTGCKGAVTGPEMLGETLYSDTYLHGKRGELRHLINKSKGNAILEATALKRIMGEFEKNKDLDS